MAAGETTRTGVCPLNCPDACSWIVTLDENGRPVRLRGNPDHRFTAGGLCVKVNPYIEHSTRPDRLTTALRRVGAKGEGRFGPISLEEAFEEMAARLHEVIDTVGPEGIWPFRGTGTVGYLQGPDGAGGRLFHRLGASRHAVTICSVAGHAGVSYTSGTSSSLDPEHISKAGAVVLWGTNTLTSNQHLFPFVRQAQRNGAPIVAIDPAATRTTRRSDLHIAPMPGTDGALGLGVMAHLVGTDAINLDYLDAMTFGWAEFCDEILSTWSAERAAAVCRIDVADVHRLAEVFAVNRPVAIKLSMGMQRHAGGGQAARVISCLPALNGDYSQLGGGLTYSTGPAYGVNRYALSMPSLQPSPRRTLAMTRLGEALLELDDPPVNALVISGANPVVSNPEQSRVREGLSRDDLFTVVIDQVMTPTIDYADIVLPATTQLEQFDLQDSYAHLYLALNEPVTAAPGDCLSNTAIFRRLAGAMGLDDAELHASDEDLAEALLDSPHPSLDGITLQTLREKGFQRLNVPDPYLPCEERFPTASGLFEFASASAQADGFGRLPDYAPPTEANASADGSLALVAGANHHLLNSSFGSSEHHQRAGSQVISVNAADAAALGVADGDAVMVENERGAFAGVADVVHDQRPGVAVTSKGLWPQHGSASVNATTAETDADMARGAVFHDNRVNVRPEEK